MIYTLDELCEKRLDWMGRVFLTNGCFDILHVGHIRLMKNIHEFIGTVPLCVGVNSDESVRILKGEPRPIMPAEERAEVIHAPKYVTNVVIFNELTADRLIDVIRPLAYFKGGDIRGLPLPEKDTLNKYWIPIVYTHPTPDKSTTTIVTKIVEEHK